MTKTDFSHPQRMNIGAFFIIMMKIIYHLILPTAAIGFYKIITTNINNNGNLATGILIMIGVCLGLSIIFGLISYFPKKFYIKDGNLIFIHGLIDRENTCVPLDRVHSLRTKRGIWYRLLNMRGIVFDTLASRQEEIELILSESEWKSILYLIEKGEKQQPTSLSESPEYNPTHLVQYSTNNLLLAALCQNHLKGMAVLGSLLGVVISNFDDLPKDATLTMASHLNAYFEDLITSPFRIMLLFAIIYIVILLLWLGKILLRYYDMTMKYDKNLLTFTYGMLTRSSCRFFRDKICTIWIKHNFLEKKFGFCTLVLKQALNATAQKEEDNLKLYGSDSSSFFLKWWLGEGYANDKGLLSARSGKGLFFRVIFLRILLTIVISICFYCSQMYLWLIVPLLYLPYTLFRGLLAMRHSKISIRSSYLIIHNGALAEMSNFIKYSNIEVVRIRQTPLTKWFHRVSLVVSTSGTTFCVRSIKGDTAKHIYDFLLYKTEAHSKTSKSTNHPIIITSSDQQ